MNKQEFLAMSLSYKPYCKTDIHDGINKNLILSLSGLIKDYARFYHKGYYFNCSLDDFKPILRPLSDLTKTIEHKGETFKPSFVLSRDFKDADDFIYLIVQILNKKEVNLDLIKVLEYCPLNVALKLIEWHFDIAGLIEKGEAIDVNTLPENPYK